ncbi:MAG: nitrate/sulfonate/bicarbonate ABC transporter ATP-binding protein [Planctomycetaceae bacterium]|nr:nitrate/sulfonate/bicarbonate ABC transporter ATP-binding protein [Planctomycetaceae bacterium]
MNNRLAIRADSLRLAYDEETIVENVNLEIPAGRFVSILGPSGCGKTSLLRMIADLQSPNSGELTVMGPAADDPRVGFVFQDATLLPWRNVVDNIRLPLELAGINRADSNAAVNRVIELVGLRIRDRSKFPRMLSGGMRMRVSLARALVTQPEILLLDEPFAALDDLLRQRLNEDLLRIWQSENSTVVFVTHNISDAVFLSQEVHVMSDKPGTFGNTLQIPFPYPRDSSLRTTLEFAQLTESLSSLLGTSNP